MLKEDVIEKKITKIIERNKINKIILKIKVISGAKKNEIIEISFACENTKEIKMRIKIRAIPEKEKGNKALIDFLSETFQRKKKNIEIVKGFHSNQKTIHIENE